MRPIRLEVEGFTCYRDRQTPLEFGGLSLFAISGPTGAGKSSILDAILYALYGEIPRIGKQGVGEVISQGRDVLSVCLDFQVRGSIYRITRRVKRGKKGALSSTATLAELAAGGERNMADGVRPVNEAVVGLLGLDYGAFTQTVVLPQGDFARFLQAEPKAQRAILQHLLRHGVFEQMRGEAERRRAQTEAELKAVDRQLDGCAGATAEALAALTLQLGAAREQVVALAAEERALGLVVQETRQRRQLTEELARLTAERATLAAAETEMERRRHEHALAQRATAIVPRLETCTAAESRAVEARRAQQRLATALAGIAKRQAAATATLTAAARAAQQCDALSARVRAIDEIKSDLQRRRVLLAAVPRVKQETVAAQKTLRSVGERATAAKTAAAARRQQAERLRAETAALACGPAERELLEDLWTQVVQARSLGEEAGRLATEQLTLQAALERAQRDARQAAETRARTAAAQRDADSEAVAAAARCTAAQASHQAHLLRQHLQPGDECPVCQQAIATLPAIAAPPELARLDAQRDAAVKHQQGAARAAQAAAHAAVAAEARVTAAAERVEATAATLAERRRAQAAAEAAVSGALAEAGSGMGSGMPVVDAFAWVESRRAELRAAQAAYEAHEQQLRAAERAMQDAEVESIKADAELQRLSESHAARVGELQRDEAELAAISARIAAVSTHADPLVERNELSEGVATLQAAEHAARAALEEIRRDAAVANATAASASETLVTAEADVLSARQLLETALAEAGFADVATLTAAARTAGQQAESTAVLRRHDDKKAAVSARLAEVEPQIAGRHVDAAQLAAAEALLARCVSAAREASASMSRLEGEQVRLEHDVARRAALVADCAQLRKRLSYTAEMAADLKGDAFQEYLLEEAFRALVVGASVRMREISNRYTLEWDAGCFYVVDHDNAGERRRAETLSGGETFMASLCLALQLSDEVLRTSGALQMDSLFIDEGFGTLDADSLGEVTDAMEALRQEGGRLIGVISHRPELTDRLPGCIRIDKGAGESRWSLERAG